MVAEPVGLCDHYAADANMKSSMCKCARLLSPSVCSEPKQLLSDFHVFDLHLVSQLLILHHMCDLKEFCVFELDQRVCEG